MSISMIILQIWNDRDGPGELGIRAFIKNVPKPTETHNTVISFDCQNVPMSSSLHDSTNPGTLFNSLPLREVNLESIFGDGGVSQAHQDWPNIQILEEGDELSGLGLLVSVRRVPKPTQDYTIKIGCYIHQVLISSPRIDSETTTIVDPMLSTDANSDAEGISISTGKNPPETLSVPSSVLDPYSDIGREIQTIDASVNSLFPELNLPEQKK